jgi:hypothetical protein
MIAVGAFQADEAKAFDANWVGERTSSPWLPQFPTTERAFVRSKGIDDVRTGLPVLMFHQRSAIHPNRCSVTAAAYPTGNELVDSKSGAQSTELHAEPGY